MHFKNFIIDKREGVKPSFLCILFKRVVDKILFLVYKDLCI